ncbi:hypothetical protein AB4K20DRAFT_1864043 [Rhizopus microsporus]|uniref:Uncharacterized protein n=1 Tax=Rhizopus microsporus TaxID=58291 RepID=A0A1X0S1Q5_RHIZD|nr:hypothetical protein BCV71DRAFT_235108 [Rhizopus microsporus]
MNHALPASSSPHSLSLGLGELLFAFFNRINLVLVLHKILLYALLARILKWKKLKMILFINTCSRVERLRHEKAPFSFAARELATDILIHIHQHIDDPLFIVYLVIKDPFMNEQNVLGLFLSQARLFDQSNFAKDYHCLLTACNKNDTKALYPVNNTLHTMPYYKTHLYSLLPICSGRI